MNIHAQTIVGIPSERRWVQAQNYQRESNVVSIVVALELEGEVGILDLASLGGSIFEKFHEDAENIVGADGWRKWVEQEILQIGSDQINVEVVVCCIEDGELWAWGTPGGSVAVARDGHIAVMGEGGWGEGLGGEVVENDVYFVGLTKLVEESLGLILQDRTRLGEQLAILMHTRSELAESAGCVIAIRDEIDVKEVKKDSFMPTVFVKREGSEARRFNMKFGIITAFVILVLVGVGLVRKTTKQQKENYQQSMQRVETMVSEAITVANQNPERARILFTQSKEVLKTYLNTKPKASYVREVESRLTKLENEEKDALKVRGMILKTTFEIALLSKNIKQQHLVGDSEGTLYFFNSEQSSVVGLNVVDLSKKTLELKKEVTGPFMITETGVLAMTTEGVWKMPWKGEGAVVLARDENWGSIEGLATFGNNLYLLDKGLGEIWKYPANGETYGERNRWFGRGIVLDLSRIVDWEVDGDIWLLSGSGKLEKFSRGVPADFGITGLPRAGVSEGMSEVVAVNVIDEKIYILERGAGRVVVLDNKGQYQQQYTAEEFSRANDLYVYEGKGYVLVDNVIKEWEL